MFKTTKLTVIVSGNVEVHGLYVYIYIYIYIYIDRYIDTLINKYV